MIIQTKKQFMETTDYQKQATDFLAKQKISFSSKFLEYGPHFPGETEHRNIYRLTLRKKGSNGELPKQFSVRFGQSIQGTYDERVPTAYDLLTCITKNDPGTYADFCSDFGYDQDSRQSERTYRAVKKEWKQVEAFFTESELEQIREIN
jgi:hypothetical protein